jgi:hypothetical protein
MILIIKQQTKLKNINFIKLNIMKTNEITIKVNQRINCKKNVGITFSLFDEEGWVGDYSVKRSEFEGKCEIISSMKTIKVKKQINCKKNFGFGMMDWTLEKGESYNTQNLKIGKKRITFSLYFDKNWIGNIFIDRREFEQKCKIK